MIRMYVKWHFHSITWWMGIRSPTPTFGCIFQSVIIIIIFFFFLLVRWKLPTHEPHPNCTLGACAQTRCLKDFPEIETTATDISNILYQLASDYSLINPKARYDKRPSFLQGHQKKLNYPGTDRRQEENPAPVSPPLRSEQKKKKKKQEAEKKQIN